MSSAQPLPPQSPAEEIQPGPPPHTDGEDEVGWPFSESDDGVMEAFRHRRSGGTGLGKLRKFPRDSPAYMYSGTAPPGGVPRFRCDGLCISCQWMYGDRNVQRESHLVTWQCARIEHLDSKCFCETHRCDGWCHRNCGKRCGYHIGHSATDYAGHGLEGQHCCCPAHTEVWVDPQGRQVRIEGSAAQDMTIYRRTPAEEWLQYRGNQWIAGGNIASHVQQQRDAARERPNHRQRSRSGSQCSNRGARSSSQGSNNRGRSGSLNFRTIR